MPGGLIGRIWSAGERLLFFHALWCEILEQENKPFA
jgi:hypothetical protein